MIVIGNELTIYNSEYIMTTPLEKQEYIIYKMMYPGLYILFGLIPRSHCFGTGGYMKGSNTNQITALYCRLSQEDLCVGESLSIENQRLLLQKHADDNGFRNCQFYVDDGYSGVDNTRPEYVRILQDVENGLIGTVIVKDQSRLGRDHLETDRLMELVFPAYDVRFIAVTDGVDSANGINEMSGIRNLFNDMYARDTIKKIRAVQRAKGEHGERGLHHKHKPERINK